MNIHKVEFLGSFLRPEEFPKHRLPEIAFAGRSNVGKSSVINVLLGQRRVAAVSAIPGKTRRINFFRVDHSFLFVDLPGYGYARVSKQTRGDWSRWLERYLVEREPLRGVVLLLDARHAPTPLDLQMKAWLSKIHRPAIVVATKMDKVHRGNHDQTLRAIGRELGLESGQSVLWFSARTGFGRTELWRAIESLLLKSEQ